MNNVSRNRALLSLIALLLISNVVLLVMLLRSKDHNDDKPGFTERLQKDVGFSQQQMNIFDNKKKAFWADMRKKFDQMKGSKESFYKQIYDSTISDSILHSKAEEIGTQQKEIDLRFIRHFKDVRTICTKEQLPKYDSLVPFIIQRMTALPVRRR